ESDSAGTIQRPGKGNRIQSTSRSAVKLGGKKASRSYPIQSSPVQSDRRVARRGFRQGLSRRSPSPVRFSSRRRSRKGGRRGEGEGGRWRRWDAPMRKFQESVKALEADIEHANALASEFLRDYDGSVIQMRMAYSAVAHFLVQWTDCKLAGALGLLKVMLYKVYADGSSALPDFEREASIREFYGVIFPSLLQLPSGITELDERKQRRLCLKKFRRRDEKLSEVDTERELECGICLEISRKVVLPDCAHTLCMRCYEDWNAKSKSCPFCRACLEDVKPGSLWMYTDDSDVVDMDTLTRENIRRLFMCINKLPLVVLHVVDLDLYEYRIK
ncbi:unnamed protein product, partial [Urochloa humidicola]